MSADRPVGGRTTLLELFQLARRKADLEVMVALPATVKSWVKPTKTKGGPFPAMVVVELDHKIARLAHEGDGLPDETFRKLSERLDNRGELTGPYPPLTLPVVYSGGSQGRLRGPLVAGDQGMVKWTDRAMGRVLVASLAGKPLDPGDDWVHGENLNDAVFEPGFTSGARLVFSHDDAVAYPEDRWIIGPDDLSFELSWTVADHLVRIVTSGETVTIDAALEVLLGSALEYAVRGDALKTALVAAADAAALAAVPMDGGKVAFQTFSSTLDATFAACLSDKVKV